MQTDKKIEKWGDFVECLAAAKKTGRNRGLSVAAIITLIYAGAFDGLVEGKPSYAAMVVEVQEALDSEAKPPKAKKGDMIGLAEAIETGDESMLHLWRWSVNPLYEFDLLKLMIPASKEFGFSHDYEMMKPFLAFSTVSHRKKKYDVFFTDRWADMFENPALLKMFQYDAVLAVPLIITETEAKTYGKEVKKERWTFKGHTGHEFTDEIVCWPDLEFTVSESQKSRLAERKMGIALVQLSVFNGRRGGSLVRWFPITGSGR